MLFPKTKSKRIALLISGQFRSFALNLRNNLQTIDKALLKGNEVEVFILVDQRPEGNFSIENQDLIINIFRQYNCKVVLFKHWEDLQKYHAEEQNIEEDYFRQTKHKRGAYPFTPNLWFRRYVINQLKNNYCKQHNIEHDIVIYSRMFDISIRRLKSPHTIRKTILNNYSGSLLMTLDTTFISSKDNIDKLLDFGRNMTLQHDDIWDNPDFYNYYSKIDHHLSKKKPTYCSEIQIFAYIYANAFKYINIRYDHTNKKSPLNKHALFKIKLCKQRHQ